ncbi:hypothetical protein PoB_000280500 [Plakobranchus ocellatus]|uniref:Uncharacterized protein n=1 Tax=Plakobranchus ocellatus TaxID=259542 RepID=A0AAV3Y0R8_9GAST|nr:hypothetical protein PoB_000280500 [Plakobranchus ocellatus]
MLQCTVLTGPQWQRLGVSIKESSPVSTREDAGIVPSCSKREAHLVSHPVVHPSTYPPFKRQPILSSTRPPVQPSTRPHVHQFTCQLVLSFTGPSIHPSTLHTSARPLIHTSTRSTVHPSTRASVYMPARPLIHWSIHPPIHSSHVSPSSHPLVHLYSHPPVHISADETYICSPIRISTLPSLSFLNDRSLQSSPQTRDRLVLVVSLKAMRPPIPPNA